MLFLTRKLGKTGTYENLKGVFAGGWKMLIQQVDRARVEIYHRFLSKTSWNRTSLPRNRGFSVTFGKSMTRKAQ